MRHFIRYCQLSFYDSSNNVMQVIKGAGLPNHARVMFDVEYYKEEVNNIAEIQTLKQKLDAVI